MDLGTPPGNLEDDHGHVTSHPLPPGAVENERALSRNPGLPFLAQPASSSLQGSAQHDDVSQQPALATQSQRGDPAQGHAPKVLAEVPLAGHVNAPHASAPSFPTVSLPSPGPVTASLCPSPSLPLGIFWDMENCSLARGTDPKIVAQSVRTALAQSQVTANTYIKYFAAYGDFSRVRAEVREAWQLTGISLADVPGGRKDAADKAIMADFYLFAMDHPPPACILVMSGDVDFSIPLHRLTNRGFRTFLAFRKKQAVSPALLSSVESVWDFDALVGGSSLIPTRGSVGRTPPPPRTRGPVFLGPYSPDRAQELDSSVPLPSVPEECNGQSGTSGVLQAHVAVLGYQGPTPSSAENAPQPAGATGYEAAGDLCDCSNASRAHKALGQSSGPHGSSGEPHTQVEGVTSHQSLDGVLPSAFQRCSVPPGVPWTYMVCTQPLSLKQKLQLLRLGVSPAALPPEYEGSGAGLGCWAQLVNLKKLKDKKLFGLHKKHGIRISSIKEKGKGLSTAAIHGGIRKAYGTLFTSHCLSLVQQKELLARKLVPAILDVNLEHYWKYLKSSGAILNWEKLENKFKGMGLRPVEPVPLEAEALLSEAPEPMGATVELARAPVEDCSPKGRGYEGLEAKVEVELLSSDDEVESGEVKSLGAGDSERMMSDGDADDIKEVSPEEFKSASSSLATC